MGAHTPELCIEAAFRFLLDREPKESILRWFDITVICRYFPDFERELPGCLSILNRPSVGGEQLAKPEAIADDIMVPRASDGWPTPGRGSLRAIGRRRGV